MFDPPLVYPPIIPGAPEKSRFFPRFHGEGSSASKLTLMPLGDGKGAPMRPFLLRNPATHAVSSASRRSAMESVILRTFSPAFHAAVVRIKV
jgi:hypothetical protein